MDISKKLLLLTALDVSSEMVGRFYQSLLTWSLDSSEIDILCFTSAFQILYRFYLLADFSENHTAFKSISMSLSGLGQGRMG